MAKRKIQELTTGVHDSPTLIGDASPNRALRFQP